MNIEELREYCLSKPHVTESFPFDDNVLVFKVATKMFALTNLNWEIPSVNLKCDPEYALELRESYEQVLPGYHMSKKHWNTIQYEFNFSEILLKELIDHSYDLVVKSLTKKVRSQLRL